LNTVVFPTFGNPIIPQQSPIRFLCEA